jgi:hypothetical protein
MRFVLALLAVLAVTAIVAFSTGYFGPAQAVCQANGSGC